MAGKALRPCAFAGCPRLCVGRFCEQHRPKETRGAREAIWRRLYGTKVWEKKRKLQLLREPFCRACAAEGIRTRATEVDHIIPHRGERALFLDDKNLQSLCHVCHAKKTYTETLGRRESADA